MRWFLLVVAMSSCSLIGGQIPSRCFFRVNKPSLNETKPRGVSTDLSGIQCDSEGERLADALLSVKIKRNLNLNGFSSLSKLVCFRANAEIVSKEISDERFICDAHLKFLLLNWPDKSKLQQALSKKDGTYYNICVLPHETDKPKGTRTANKQHVLWWLEHKQELIPVGIHICSSHRMMMQADENSTLKENIISTRVQPQRPVSGLRKSGFDNDWEPTGDYDDMYDDYGCNNDGNLATCSEEEEKAKKINMACKILADLCKVMCGDDGDKLMDSILKKLGAPANNEDCSKQVLEAIGERMSNAKNRRERVEAISILVDIPHFSSYSCLLSIPGVTKYLIHQSRLFARSGLDLDRKFTKVRYNKPAISFFLSFLVRSNALVSLPWVTNTVKRSDGQAVDLASTIRTQTYSRIIRLYKDELIMQTVKKDDWLSDITAYNILKKIVPKMSTRKTCVNEFAVIANEAWRILTEIVKDSGVRGILSSVEESDVLRRIRVTKSFVECNLRNYIELSSSVIQHCAMFALSDPTKAHYRSICKHNHDEECMECSQVSILLSLIAGKLNDATATTTTSNQYEIERMIQLVERCERDLNSFVAHIIRGVVSDTMKQDVYDNLEEDDCFMTLDWAQKYLPTSAEEAQSSFYAKAGISLHCVHVCAIKNGLRVDHSFLHTIDVCCQDSNSVSAILEHILYILACYKSGSIIGDLYHLSQKYPAITSYIYSESQLGKGPCDRTISHCKRVANEHTNGLMNCQDASELCAALSRKDAVRGTSTYHCSIDGDSDATSKIVEISSIYDVRFESDGVRARKHCGIGEGLLTASDELAALGASLTVIKEAHEMEGVHNIRQKKQTLLDFAIDTFSEHVETEEAARLRVTEDGFQAMEITPNGKKLKEGYGLKKIKNNPIVEKARKEVEIYFMRHRSMQPPKRACPRTFSQQMKVMKNDRGSGEYKFKVSELLSEKQVQGLFSRLEKKRISTVSVARAKTKDATKSMTSASSRKRKHPDFASKTFEESHPNDSPQEEEEEDEDELEFLHKAVLEEKDELFED